MNQSDASYAREKTDRGSAAELQIFADDSGDWMNKEETTTLTLVGGTLNEVERGSPLSVGAQQVDAAIHPDGSVTVKTYRYATNIPFKELEILYNLAKAVREEQDKPMEVPF